MQAKAKSLPNTTEPLQNKSKSKKEKSKLNSTEIQTHYKTNYIVTYNV